jgi:hypothetical protein
MGIGAERLDPSYEIFNSTSVGWVERSDTHRPRYKLGDSDHRALYLSVQRSTDFFSR